MKGRHGKRPNERKQVPQIAGRDEVAHGHICEIHPDKGFGRIETHDGRVIYFYKESVQDHPFENLTTGTEVRFASRAGNRPAGATVAQVID